MDFCPVCDVDALDQCCDHAKITTPVTLLPCPFCGGPPAPFHLEKPIAAHPEMGLKKDCIRLKGRLYT